MSTFLIHTQCSRKTDSGSTAEWRPSTAWRLGAWSEIHGRGLGSDLEGVHAVQRRSVAVRGRLEPGLLYVLELAVESGERSNVVRDIGTGE